jgi:hypothetical protein
MSFGAWVVVLVNAMTEAHELDAGVLVLDLLHELANLGNATHFLDVFQHVQARLVRTAVGGTPQASHTSRDGSKGLVPELPHSRTVEVEAFCS